MKIQLVVFDLAGTTVEDNQDVHRVLQSTLRKHDVPVTVSDANEVMGIPKPTAIRKLLQKHYGPSVTLREEWIDEIHKHFVSEMVWFYETNNTVKEKSGVSETFKALKKKGIKIAVDTGFSRTITTSLLKRMTWVDNNLIDTSVTSDEVARGRPYPDLIFAAMKKTQVSDATYVAKVGDTASDIQEGRAAGCSLTVGVTTGAYSAEALKKENPTHLIDEIPELLGIID